MSSSDSDNDNDNYLSDKVIVSEEGEEDEDISSNSDDLHTSIHHLIMMIIY